MTSHLLSLACFGAYLSQLQLSLSSKYQTIVLFTKAYYYQDKGIMDDAAVYRDILSSLQKNYRPVMEYQLGGTLTLSIYFYKTSFIADGINAYNNSLVNRNNIVAGKYHANLRSLQRQ